MLTWPSWERTAACSTARWYIGPAAQAAIATTDSSNRVTDCALRCRSAAIANQRDGCAEVGTLGTLSH